ncbi:MAG: hypothetical protein KGJ78_01755 [Alphaproteobacteria bacterium]|nr:hypothetical protein [Alphaproteobacteria bacterium]
MRPHLIAVLSMLAALSFAAGAEPSALTNVRSIGVIVALDDTLAIVHVGPTTADTTVETLPIADWNLDDTIIGAVQSSLAPRYSVVKINDDLGAFRRVEADTPFRMAGDLEDLVGDLPKRELDAYLVVKPFRSYADLIGAAYHGMTGLGIYRNDAGGEVKNGEYAFFALFVIDAKSAHLLASAAPCTFKAGGPCEVATWWTVDGRNFADARAISAEQRAALKQDFTKHLDDGIKGALANLGLSPPAAALQ